MARAMVGAQDAGANVVNVTAIGAKRESDRSLQRSAIITREGSIFIFPR
jgi:hypothetical protein